jgi:hypothetical protein
MGKQYKNIDDLFRTELIEDEVVVPDFVKENIDAALGFNNSKKYFYFLISFLGLIVIASLLFFIPDWSSNTAFSRKNGANFSNSNQLTSLTTSSANLTHTDNNSTHQREVSDTNSPLNGNGSLRQNTNYSLKNKITYNSTDKQKKNTTEDAGNFISSEGIRTKKDKKSSGSSKDGSVKADAGGDITSFVKMSSNQGNGNNFGDNSNGDSGGFAGDLGDSKDVLANQDPAKTAPEIDQKTETGPTETGDKKTSGPSKVGSSINNSSTDKNPINIISKPDKTYQPWMLTMTSGVTFAKSNYTANTPLDAITFNTSTSDRIGNQTSFDAMYRFKIPLSIGVGIGLANYSDNYNFERKTYQIDSVLNENYSYYEKIYGTYYSTPVDTFETVGAYTFVKDSVLVTIDSIYSNAEEKEIIENFIGRNSACYLMLPIHLGTHFSYKKFDFELLASARFNFLLNSSGGYLLNNEFTSFTKSTSIYKPFYVDLALSSRINYNIWKNLYLAGSLQYRPRIGTSFENVNFNKTFNSFHVSLGIGIKL